MTRNEVEILLKTVYKGEGATKALADMDKISASGEKVSGALNKVNKAMGGDVLGGTGGSASFRKRNPQLFQNATRTIGALMPNNAFLTQGAKNLMGMGPLFTPPPIPPGAGGGAPGAAGAGSGGFGAAFLKRLGSRAISIVAGLLVYRALNAAMLPLIKTVKGLTDAFEIARKLYAKSLTSGLGLGATTRRSVFADVLGVSEKDLYQFGRAVLFISPGLRHATDILAKTAPNLASVSFQFRILKTDLEALFASIANDAAPALRKFASGMSSLTKQAETFYEAHKKGMQTLINVLLDFAWLFPVHQIVKLVGSQGKDAGPAPQPLAFMKQIQASAWEKMGLIIGGVGASSPAQETARNTKVTAEGVKQLVKAVGGGHASFGYRPFDGAQSYQ